MLVVLLPDAGRELSLGSGAARQLAALGVTRVAVLRDDGTLGFLLEGWAFNPGLRHAAKYMPHPAWWRRWLSSLPRCLLGAGRPPRARRSRSPSTSPTTSFWGSGRSERGQVPLERPALREGAGRIADYPDRAGQMGPSERASDGRRRVHDPRPCEGSALLTPPLVGLRVTAVPERTVAPPIEQREPSMPEMNRQDTSSLVHRHRQTCRPDPGRRIGHKRWP
jgi:hypothetical protein